MKNVEYEIEIPGLQKSEYCFNEPLKQHTSIKVGGYARVWARPKDVDSLRIIIKYVTQNDMTFFVIGNGSNIIISDVGINGFVINLSALNEITINNSVVTVGSGTGLNVLIDFCKKHSLSGLEFLAGIPGTVGGAIKMNAGVLEKEIKDVLVSIEIMDKNGDINSVAKDDMKFDYRTSNIDRDCIILNGSFSIVPDSQENISNRMKEYLDKRKKSISKEPSVGSIFKNPCGDKAGRIIDSLGLKGTHRGGAMISQEHANIIINTGNARSFDIKELIDFIKEEVLLKTDIQLEEEIEFWGK